MSTADLVTVILWLAVCTLARTPRERGFCLFGTALLMTIVWVMS